MFSRHFSARFVWTAPSLSPLCLPLGHPYRAFGKSAASQNLGDIFPDGRFHGRLNRFINFLPSGYQYVVERFGKFHSVKKPGLHVLIPILDQITYVVDDRELCIRIDPENAVTHDNVKVTIGGNLFVFFYDAERAAYGASRPIYSVQQFSQSVMRSSVGNYTLDALFKERETLNEKIVDSIQSGAAKWGGRIVRFEITDLECSDHNVEQSLHLQSTAEREKREKETSVEAEYNVIRKQADAYAYKQKTEAEGDAIKIRTLADGEAHKIRTLADAHAYTVRAQAEAEKTSIKEIGDGMHQTAFGMDVLRARLSGQYFKALEQLGQRSTIIVPHDLANLASMVKAGQAYLLAEDDQKTARKN